MATATRTSKTTQALEIQVFDGTKVLARESFEQSKVILGRIQSADLKIQDPRVSRIHALIERLDDGSLRLTDLASSHGTFVNGERIVERMIGLTDEIKLATLSVKIGFVAPPKFEDKVIASPYKTSIPRISPADEAHVSDKIINRPSDDRPAPSVDGMVREASDAQSVEPIPSAPKISVSRDPTVIRSLKETARNRGVLEQASMGDDLEVTVYWEEMVLAVDHYKKKDEKTITIGQDFTSKYIVPEASVPNNFPFIKVSGQSAIVQLHPAMKGSVRTNGKMQSLEDLKRGGGGLTLSGQDIAKIQVGTVHFFLMFVPEPPPIPKDRIFDQGPLYWGIQFSIAAFAIVLLTLATVFRQPIEGEVKEFPENLRKIIIEEFKKQKVVPPPVAKVTPPSVVTPPPVKPTPAPVKAAVAQAAKQGGNEGEGARERGAEGKRGWKNSPNETGITNRPKVSADRHVKDAPVRASNEGVVNALRNTGLGARLAKVSGAVGGASGNDPLDQAFLGVGGGGIQSGRGSGGSGLQGTGTGGGGTAVGVGGLGSKGFGGGASGTGIGSIPGKGDFSIGTEATSVQVLGALSRDEIRRVVEAHQSEVRFCYSRELQRDPKLFGKVNMKWLISAGGDVQTASVADNTTGSVALANCIREKVVNWKFPQSPGGVSNVEWPWIFKPTGS